MDSGPSDRIHDLHAKYQAGLFFAQWLWKSIKTCMSISKAAVNKAENVAQAALRAAGEALSEQSKDKDHGTVGLDSFSSSRFKRSAPHFEEEKTSKKKHEEEPEEEEEEDEDENEDEDMVHESHEIKDREPLMPYVEEVREEEEEHDSAESELREAAEEEEEEEEEEEGSDNPVAVRVKAGKDSASKIAPEKIDTMIDLMNSLNQQFGTN